MASAEIDSGICGFCTTVRTKADGASVNVVVKSSCSHVQALAEQLTIVQPFTEISFRGDGPQTLRLAAKYLVHPACPVPSGIIKAIEVESGLALPKDASIRPARD
jgi:hypothetical protein